MKRDDAVMTAMLHDRMLELLQPYVTPLVARAVVDCLEQDRGIDLSALEPLALDEVIRMVDEGVRPFLSDSDARAALHESLAHDLSPAAGPGFFAAGTRVAPAEPSTIVVNIESEYDIMTARGKGREICERAGFPKTAQVKVATVVSELARNIIQYAGRGRIEITTLTGSRSGIEVVASDHGPGIPHIDTVLSGAYQSKTGMGMGLYGTRNLMDDFDVKTGPGIGTTVRARKYL